MDCEKCKARRQQEVQQEHQQNMRQLLLEQLQKQNQANTENQVLFDGLHSAEKDMKETHDEGMSTLMPINANSNDKE